MKEAGGCLSNVSDAGFFVQKFARNLNHVFFFTQLLGAASRGQKILIIYEDALFLHMKLLLDTNRDHFLLFLLPVSLLVTTI